MLILCSLSPKFFQCYVSVVQRKIDLVWNVIGLPPDHMILMSIWKITSHYCTISSYDWMIALNRLLLLTVSHIRRFLVFKELLLVISAHFLPTQLSFFVCVEVGFRNLWLSQCFRDGSCGLNKFYDEFYCILRLVRCNSTEGSIIGKKIKTPVIGLVNSHQLSCFALNTIQGT